MFNKRMNRRIKLLTTFAAIELDATEIPPEMHKSIIDQWYKVAGLCKQHRIELEKTLLSNQSLAGIRKGIFQGYDIMMGEVDNFNKNFSQGKTKHYIQDYQTINTYNEHIIEALNQIRSQIFAELQRLKQPAPIFVVDSMKLQGESDKLKDLVTDAENYISMHRSQ